MSQIIKCYVMETRRIEICQVLCEGVEYPASAWHNIYRNLLQPLRKELMETSLDLVVERHKRRDLYIYACKRSYQFYTAILKDAVIDASEVQLRLGDLARYLSAADSRRYRLDVAKQHYQSSGFGLNGAPFMQLYIIYNSMGEKELALLAVLRGCILGNGRAKAELNRATRNAGLLGNLILMLQFGEKAKLSAYLESQIETSSSKLLACTAALAQHAFPGIDVECSEILRKHPLEQLTPSDIDLKHLTRNL